MRHSYRDPATGRFAQAPPPPPPRPTPPRWVNGRFVKRTEWTVIETHETRFTGKSKATALAFATAKDAALVATSIASGGSGPFLAEAFTRVSVRPTPEGWAVRIEYNYPLDREGSP